MKKIFVFIERYTLAGSVLFFLDGNPANLQQEIIKYLFTYQESISAYTHFDSLDFFLKLLV